MSEKIAWRREDGKTSFEEDESAYLKLRISFKDFMLQIGPLSLAPPGVLPSSVAWWMEWQTNNVIFPYFASPDYDVDIEKCKEKNITLDIRAPVGGGTSWLDKGCPITGVGFRRDHPKCPLSLEEFYKKLYPAFVKDIGEEFGIKTRFKPLNDVEVYCDDGVWRKISIASGVPTPTFMAVGAGIQTTPVPWELVDEVILPPPEKFADKETKTMRDRSTYLNSAIGREVTLDELSKVMKESIENAFGLTLVPTEIYWENVPGYDVMKGMLTADTWFLDRSEKLKFKDTPITKGVKKGEARVKIPQGPFVRAVVLTKAKEIYNLLITGSLHASPLIPESPIHKIEKEVQGAPIDKGAIKERIEKILSMEGQEVANITSDQLAELIIKGCEVAS
ncbi:MAG: biotin/lipoate A/B protein ligase family protein [Candidatus Lokiarchaeia archaeon]